MSRDESQDVAPIFDARLGGDRAPVAGAAGSPEPPYETADDPRIPPDRMYFKIGEAAKITGLKAYVLRYWETEFPWIRPTKTSARQRLYRRQDIAVLLEIKRLRYDEQRTIADTKNLIRARRGEDHRRPKPPLRRPSKGGGGAPEDAVVVLAEMRRTVIEILEAVGG